jgi:hypothetical protein
MLIILNNKFSGNRKIMDLKTRFIKLKESLIFALVKGKTDKGIEYYYSDKEKTELDEVYLYKKGRVPPDKKTKTYLKKYPKWVGKK